jgi:sigma-B regulation protein RsbU (phosphoserine phosphatase)
MFYGLLDATSGEFAFTNAGHNPPILVKADGRVTRLEPTGPVAGIFPLAAYHSADEQMAEGDYLVIFSDGVTEHKNRAGEEFGETRLTKTLLEAVDRSADEICTAIIDSLITFAGNRPYEDDVTIVVLRRAVTTPRL